MTERHCWSRLSRALRWALLVMACVTTIASCGDGSGLHRLTDAPVHPPPATGPFAHNSFVPPVMQGASYVDPVFGTTVRRVTTSHCREICTGRRRDYSPRRPGKGTGAELPVKR